MPSIPGEIGAMANGRDTTSTAEKPVLFAQDPQHTQQQQQQQQQQYLQAGTISPGVTFADDNYEQYDSDMEADLDLGPSLETLQEGQILKSGYLHKKGERTKIWKKKWFVLRTSKLAYYKDSKEYVLNRIIDIRDIHKAAEVEVKNRTGVFLILTPRRTFTIQAESVTEMEEWVEAINQAKVHYELTSSSDIDSFSASTSKLDLPNSAPTYTSPAMGAAGSLSPGPGRAPELTKQASGTFMPRRQQPRQGSLSLSDPTLLAVDSGIGARIGTKGSAPSPTTRVPDSKVSGLSLGIMSQSMGQMPSSPLSGTPANNSGRHLQANRTDGLSLVTSGTQAIRIGTSPTSPFRRDQHHDAEFAPNSYSSNHSFTFSPNSPVFGPGEHQFGMGEHNVSSEEEDVLDDPTVLEAGRVAAEANAPGSGLVTNGEQLNSKVVRQGYLLKLGNTYKTWRKKWFVLRGDKLTYYKNTKEYQPLGIIPLSTIIDSLQTDPVSKNKQFCLRIVTNKRSFVCCAPDEDTLLQWIDALHVECARVAREAKLEKQREEEELYHDDDADDEEVLSDPRALGRTAHFDLSNGGLTSPLATTAGALGSSPRSGGSPLKPALRLDTSTNHHGGHGGHGSTSGIAFSASPIGPSSATFQATPSRNTPTVTFSV
ncbi:hypothetical protein BGX31_004876 [Mortierella sp. GBA43]|nr:hypothetical protein BGX31_004876 [Mortierella sp. GBA43]